ncbi:MAG: hypothetical protein ACRDY7_10985 [Acidimicrobiia bacterium]
MNNPMMRKSMMRRVMAGLFAGTMLVAGGAACDDNESNGQGIDEDDSRVGPGDGEDEFGPGR